MNARQLAALAGVIVVGVATALGVDVPKDEIAGAVTALVTAAAGVIGIIVAARDAPSSPPDVDEPPSDPPN